MDWDAYKARCDDPRVLSRWMLTRTARWVDPANAAILHEAMRAPPLPKPAGHKGSPATDMFEVDVADEAAAAILEAMQRAAAEHRGAGDPPPDGCRGAPTPSHSLNAYVAAWREYRDAGRP